MWPQALAELGWSVLIRTARCGCVCRWSLEGSEVRSDWLFACNKGGGNSVVCPIVSPSNAGDVAFTGHPYLGFTFPSSSLSGVVRN